MKFFSPDSKFAQVMTSFGEIMLLNLCYILACLPLVTVGAANTAMYTMMGRRLREEGGGTVVPFFKAWWSNLKLGTFFWVIQAAVSFSLGLTVVLPLPSFLKILAAVLLVLVTLLLSIIYPQLARYRNRPFAYLRNAVILLLTKPGWVLLNLVLFLIPIALFLLFPVEFLQFGVIWLLCGFSALFLVSAEVMQKILKPLEELSSKK
ncbi:MAG: YesL family protein [Oscillospiraceae bacterium]|nr:YesL family protein [Oscillospiraceae bacterium]